MRTRGVGTHWSWTAAAAVDIIPNPSSFPNAGGGGTYVDEPEWAFPQPIPRPTPHRRRNALTGKRLKRLTVWLFSLLSLPH